MKKIRKEIPILDVFVHKLESYWRLKSEVNIKRMEKSEVIKKKNYSENQSLMIDIISFH